MYAISGSVARRAGQAELRNGADREELPTSAEMATLADLPVSAAKWLAADLLSSPLLYQAEVREVLQPPGE